MRIWVGGGAEEGHIVGVEEGRDSSTEWGFPSGEYQVRLI